MSSALFSMGLALCLAGCSSSLDTPAAWQAVGNPFAGAEPLHLRPPPAGAAVRVPELIDVLQKLDKTVSWPALEAGGYTRCAVFDADGTLWKDDVSEALVGSVLEQGEVLEAALEVYNRVLTRYGEPMAGSASEAIARLGDAYGSGRLFSNGAGRGLSRDEVNLEIWPSYNWAFTGWEAARLTEKCKAFAPGFEGHIYAGIRQLLEYLRQSGYRTVVVSAGIEEAVRAAAAPLGFGPDELSGMRSRVVNGLVAPEIDPPVMYAAGKLEAARKLCGGRPFMALGDSVDDSDREMLAGAFVGVAVEPRGDHLARARAEKYLLLDFERTEGGASAQDFRQDRAAADSDR